MMSAKHDDLASRAQAAASDEPLRRAVRFTVERLRNAKRAATEVHPDWEALREQGQRIRAHTIRNLDTYLARFAERAEAQGAHVHFAADAAEARDIALRIVREKRAKLVVKGKSMLSEEVGLNHALEDAGIEHVETDLGEWIVQLAHETPSHIILPAIHKTRAQIQALFEAEGRAPLAPDTHVLAAHARRRMRRAFAAAEVGITGCNFAVAETGSIVLFTNEGNGRMSTTLPATHIAFMGMERIVPTFRDLAVMAELLPRSATGQKLTTYVNVLNGPRRDGELDGAREMHIIIVDNGRSEQLGDPDFESILHCIRCGACLNVCPVYRHIGGHAYGSVYTGPIGAVLTPRLQADPRARELAQASTLCGACYEACPVKIPLHDMLARLRHDDVTSGRSKLVERKAFRLYAWLFASSTRYAWVMRMGRTLRALPYADRLGAWLTRLLLPGVVRDRVLPAPAPRSFRELFRDSMKDGSDV